MKVLQTLICQRFGLVEHITFGNWLCFPSSSRRKDGGERCQARAGGAAGPLRQEERQGVLAGLPCSVLQEERHHRRKPLSAEVWPRGLP